jgi:hypothetical protein
MSVATCVMKYAKTTKFYMHPPLSMTKFHDHATVFHSFTIVPVCTITCSQPCAHHIALCVFYAGAVAHASHIFARPAGGLALIYIYIYIYN